MKDALGRLHRHIAMVALMHVFMAHQTEAFSPPDSRKKRTCNEFRRAVAQVLIRWTLSTVPARLRLHPRAEADQVVLVCQGARSPVETTKEPM
jgi:hypothetical protein